MKKAEFSIVQFAFVYAAVIALALTTWGLAQIRLGPSWVNTTVSLLIAFTKAALVVAVFMNLKHGRPLTKLFASAGIVWFLILVTVLTDYFTRPWDTVPHSWVPTEQSHIAGGVIASGAPTPTIYSGRPLGTSNGTTTEPDRTAPDIRSSPEP